VSFSIRRGDIFYVHKFGIQVGSEEHTGRPGVVVSCDEGNRYSETVQVAYCTTQPKSNLPTHVEILSTGRASTVMCEQINTVSLERLRPKRCVTSTSQLRQLWGSRNTPA
jgi:mRNA interferase MazF